MMITVGHCRTLVPAPKYHAELEMMSRRDEPEGV